MNSNIKKILLDFDFEMIGENLSKKSRNSKNKTASDN